jgi:SLT domain-containing protein
MLDAHGNLKSLSTDMGVLYKHIEEHSKGGSEKNGFFKSIFGTSGMNGAMILAKSSKEVEGLTKRTEKAGKTGTYVAKLAAKNMGTAQGSANSAKQAMNAFKMTLGNAVLPAINQASNALAKFLLSKDGKKFQKDVGGAVAHVANGLVKFIKWGTTHKGTLKAIGGAILAGYTVTKGLQFVAFLGDVKKSIDALKGSSAILNGIADATKAITGKEVAKKGVSSTLGGLFNKGEGAGKFTGKGKLLNGAFQSVRSAGGLKSLTGVGRVATGASIAGIVADVGYNGIYKAFKDRHNATKRSQDIGKGIGAGIGGGIGLYFGGPLGAAIGAKIGGVAGKWGGYAVDRFTKGWQKKKPPKSFWSLENLGWSTHNMFKGMGKGWNSFWGGMGDWRKKEARAFGRWASQTGRSINKGFNGAKAFIKNIPSNLGKTGKSIKKWADNIGQNIHKGWNKGITASHKFFKNLPKNIDKTKQNIGKWTSKTGKDISSAWRKGQKATVNFVKHIPSNLGKAQKSVERWGRKTGKNIGSAWHKGTTAVGKFVGSIPSHLAKAERSTARWAGKTGKNIHSAWDKGKQGLTSFVTSIPKELGKAYTAVLDWAGKVGKTVSKAWNNFWGKAGDIRKGITNNVKAFGNDLAFASGHSKHTFKYEKIRSHASGGLITVTHHALVGEAGPELAYKRGLNARLLGTNGPQITRVHAGEHILNARDTAKVLSGGLGTGTILKGYASGTDRLKTASKSVTDDYRNIADKSTKSLKKLTRSNKKAFSQVNSDASKQTKQAKTRTVANFSSLHKNVSKLTDKTQKDSITNFKQMHHGINKQMDAIHDGVISSGKSTAKGFGGAMDKMHKYAHSAMADTTRQLNKGISSIDKVLGQFGGNNSVIKPIKFAKGTDQQGRLTHNTLAMVNDATQGSRQEALVSPDNKLYLPRGQNVQLMLPAGWGVLNGTQTKQVINKTVNHFARGTGISHSALRKLAERAGADPSKWFKSTYSNDIKQHGSDLNKGTTALGSNSSTKYGNPWSNALWSVINKQIDSDDGGSINATGLLKAAEKYGEGHKYVWGAGGSDHVGIYAGGNKYFSAESPAQGIHMNTLDSVVGKGRPLFGRIKGMPSQKAKPKHQQADSRLVALVKRELGSHALRWIKDNLGEGGSFGNPAGDGVARWRKYIIRAASQMHTSVTGTEIAKILSMISSESSGNPTITQQIQDINSANGTPAQGLLQFVPSTFNAFAVKGHHKLLNGYDQLLALFNDSNWRNDIHFGGGWGPSGHRRFAKGGRPKVGQNVIVGENGPEIARFDSPVQIYSNEKSRRSLNLGKLPDVQSASSKKHFTDKFAPVININFNGSASDFDSKQARKIAEIVQRELEKVFNSIDEEFC